MKDSERWESYTKKDQSFKRKILLKISFKNLYLNKLSKLTTIIKSSVKIQFNLIKISKKSPVYLVSKFLD